jgi:hypothetical protein
LDHCFGASIFVIIILVFLQKLKKRADPVPEAPIRVGSGEGDIILVFYNTDNLFPKHMLQCTFAISTVSDYRRVSY